MSEERREQAITRLRRWAEKPYSGPMEELARDIRTVLPALSSEPEEGWAKPHGDGCGFDVSTIDGVPARDAQPCVLILLPRRTPTTEPGEAK